jgi:outer membrane immunogenic protein
MLMATTGTVLGQSMPAFDTVRGDAALTYQWMRTNTQPGDCGCFGLNGAGLSASWNSGSYWSAVAEGGAHFATNGPGTGKSLTLLSLFGGARYYVPYGWHHENYRVHPFTQALVGFAHANGGIAGAGDSSFALVGRIGGGLDLSMSSRLAVRLLQADYDISTFRNGVNDRQNNLLLGAGVVFRWLR